MPPKKKQEEASERPPEGDDERQMTISIVATFKESVGLLKSPIVVLGFSGSDDLTKVEVPAEAIACRRFSCTMFSKKLVLTPTFVENTLGGRVTVSLLSMLETKEVQAPTKPAKGGLPVTGKGKVPASVLEIPVEDLSTNATFSFDLCETFTKKDVTIDLMSLPISFPNSSCVESAIVQIQTSDVLFAQSNLVKYLPVVVEVTEITNLPCDGAIPLEHEGIQRSSSLNGNVFVEFEFLGDVVRTAEVPRSEKCKLAFKRAFFLHKYKQLDVMQLLFRPIEFEVHDQEHIKSKLKPSFGVGLVNLRQAVTDQVRRFATSSQVIPARQNTDGSTPSADYISFATTLKTVIEFLAPLPRPVYFSDSGAAGECLSRALIVMPYDGVASVLQAIMGTLVTLKKGGVDSNVREVEQVVQDTKKGNPTPTVASSSTFRLAVPVGVTGFEVMDDEVRIMCFEGPLSIVHKLAEVATAVIGDDPKFSVLMNSELQFPERLYHSWPSLVVPMIDRTPKAPTPPPDTTKAGSSQAKKPAAVTKKKEVEPPRTPTVELEDAPPEIDAGGVGGRIRRIRLGTTIRKLAGVQRNFIKRTLPIDAVTCVSKLGLLRKTTSVLNAVDMNLFPTSAELIALERVHGETLELMDVCGSNDFMSFSDADVGSIVNQAQKLEKQSVSKVRSVDVCSLCEDDVGLVVSFEGIPANGEQSKGLKLGVSFSRFQHKSFIYNIEQGKTVACAFSSEPPKQMLRHSFTGQVVSSSGTPVLFVIDFHSLAKKSSDHINSTYDKKLQRDKQRAPAAEYFAQLAARRSHYNSTHTLSRSEFVYRDESSDDEESFVDGPPSVSIGLEQRELIPNYVVLNQTMQPSRTVTSSDHPDYNLARALYDSQTKRLFAAEARVDAVSDKQFQTVLHKAGAESRQHPWAPSPQRVDDLHQPWEAPSAYRGTKVGNNPFRFQGGRQVLEDKERHKSIFGGLSAEEQALQEQQDNQQALEDWKKQVVVADPTFKVTCKMPTEISVCQTDRLKPLLEDPPKKKSLKETFVGSAPASIFSHELTPRNTKVDPSASKHPEVARFYYPKVLHSSSITKKPITPREQASPLYYH